MQKRRKMLTWLLTMMMALGLFGAQASIAGAAVSMDFYDYTVSPSELSASDKVLCDAKTFRAKVVDEKGNPVEGVSVLIKDNENMLCEYTVTSGKDGVVSHEMIQGVDYSLTFNVNVKDSAWTSENTHTFVTGGDASITKVNGKAPADADEMVFVVKKGGTPAPSKVLSDSTHFVPLPWTRAESR